MSLVAELRRRNVFKVGAAYLVVGWLVIQAADLLAPQLNLPEWAPRLVTFLVLVGLPLALVLAWIFDLTPEGIQLAEGRVGNKRFYAVVGLITLLVLAWFFARPGGEVVEPSATDGPVLAPASSAASQPAAPAEAAPSIAVLPFVNMSPDPENEFFADGISEELLNILARIPGLKVASRTSAFSFKGSSAPIPSIAGALKVGHVLEGSVRKQGDRVRITAQLVHAETDTHLWSDSYDRQLTDIFKVQEEIAQSITTALESVLGARQVQVVAPTRDLEAYQRFLQGRTRFFRRAELDDALADFQFAVGRDPAFADAWAFMAATAMVHSVSGYPTRLDRAEIGALVEPALDRALALESGMPLVLAVQGYFFSGRNDPAGRIEGLALMERAAAAEVADSTARMWLGMNRLQLGWIDQAVAALESAYESDPLVPINTGYYGLAQFMAGDETEGERLARHAVELGGWTTAVVLLSSEFARRGDLERARQLMELRFQVGLDAQQAARMSAAYVGALQDPGQWQAYRALLVESGLRGDQILDFELATADADALFARLSSGASWLQFLWVSMAAWLPSMEWLREDPRFYAFMEARGMVGLWERLGFPGSCRPVEGPAGRRLECDSGD